MRKKLLSSVCIVLLSFMMVEAQSVLTPESFLEKVVKDFPQFQIADLKINQAEAAILASKGIFDPTLKYFQEKKTLGGDNYYNHQNADLSLYTPLGITVKAGVENNLGKYLNPELTKGTLSYLGIEIPVLKGLLIDEKRAELRQARVALENAGLERRLMLNQVLYEAMDAYIDWATAYAELQFLNNSIEIAQNTLTMTRQSFFNGDYAAMDTTEAYGQVLSIELSREQATQNYYVALLMVNQFLWAYELNTLIIDDSYIPDAEFLQNLPLNTDAGYYLENIDAHPSIRQYEVKQQSLAIEQRLKRQYLLPDLKLKGNLLSKDYYAFSDVYSPYLANNYKFGIDLKIPLLFREGRGNLEKTKLKIQETDFMQQLKERELKTKITQNDIQIKNYLTQANLADRLTENYTLLLNQEIFKFQQGEADLFYVNTRQNKLIDSYIKLLSLRSKYLKYWYKQQFTTAQLFEN